MKVEFFFDPSCPWCWVTSRWLLLVSNNRDIDITWRPFSLAIKNNQLDSDDQKETPHGASGHRAAHRILRVALAAAETDKVSLIEMYTAFGIPFHAAGFAYDDDMIRDALADKGLDAALLAAADDIKYDQQIRDSMQDAQDAAGEDIGVPTIVFVADDGTRKGYFGPVLDRLPDDEEALKLWDGLSNLATATSFYELKRSRHESGGPDIGSTARC